MDDGLPQTSAASAVSQALGDIGLCTTKKPPLPLPPSLLVPEIGQAAITRRALNDPSSSSAPRPRSRMPLRSEPHVKQWKTALGNQLQHVQGDNRGVGGKQQLNTNTLQPHTAIKIHEDPTTHESTSAGGPTRSPFRTLRANGVFQNEQQRQRQLERRQKREEGDMAPTAGSGSSPIQASANTPSSTATTRAVRSAADAKAADSSGRRCGPLPLPASPAPSPPTANDTVVLPVLPLLRRQQAPRRSQPSPHHRSASSVPTISTPTKQAQTLFFQASGDEQSSNIASCSIAESIIAVPTVTTATETEEAKDKELAKETSSTTREPLHRQVSDRRSSDEDDSSHSFSANVGRPERIGKLSSEEDEFDFAILLKPSKYEEHVDLSGAVTAIARSPASTLKPSGKVDSTSARAEITRRIQRTGLHVKRLLSLDGKQSLLKVCAPQRVLELGAERLRLRKQRRFDQVWMVFSCELRASFADFDPVRGLVNFLDSEKQSIVHALLTAPETDGGAGLNECCPVTMRFVLQMYPLHKQDLALLKARWVTFWRSPAAPKSQDAANSRSPSTTRCSLVRGVLQQPLDDVAQYFGERIAFYFAWMEMYTRWLVVPSVAGSVLFVLQVQAHQLDHPAAPLYALFMALWTSAFILAWRRRAAALAYRWGTLGYEDEEVTRPEFYGDRSSTTRRSGGLESDHEPSERRYASWKRLLKYSVTMPCVGGSIITVVVLTYLAFSTRDRLEAQSLATKRAASQVAEKVSNSGTVSLEDLRALARIGVSWSFWVYLLLTPVLYGLLIPVLDFAFTRAARALNNWENHRTESRYQSHLILKVFSFRFVHVFASLYYYAFAPMGSNEGGSEAVETTGAVGKAQKSEDDGLLRVAIQLASFMVAGQLWKNVMETLYPFVRRRLDARAKKRATNEKFNQSAVFNGVGGASARRRAPNLMRGGATTTTRLAAASMMSSNAVIHEQCVRLEQASDRAWEEAGLQQYDTFEDYTEMLVQFGYVSFFSLAFPLAPLLALLNNLLELRTDAFKLCHAKQRPLARKASGIGVWLHVLQLMSVLAVLTNCFHLAYSTSLLERAFPSVNPTQKAWIVFGVEHLLLLLKVWLACVIPAVSHDVAGRLRRERELAKHDSARAMATRMLAEAEATDAAKDGEDGESSPTRRRSLRHRPVEA